MTGMMNKIYVDAKVHFSFYSGFSSVMQLHQIAKKKEGWGRAVGWTNQKAYS
jgi:hypothetical protein